MVEVAGDGNVYLLRNIQMIWICNEVSFQNFTAGTMAHSIYICLNKLEAYVFHIQTLRVH